ncbi:MAG: AMP-binding protein [Crocinitomicaceae bacterium]|nr:AMP-binding protein [Crocinitomicaceae bacterium]
MQVSYSTNNAQLIDSVEQFIEIWNDASLDFSTPTSGSTGIPKSILISKQHARASAQMTGEFLDLNKGDTALLCLSPTTIAGKMMIVRSIVLEMNLIVTDVNSDPLNSIDEHIDFAAMVPLQAQGSLQALNRIQKLIVGGGTISNNLWDELSNKSTTIYQTYGMTETISHVAMRKVGDRDRTYKALPRVEFNMKNGALNISAPHLGITDIQTNDAVELLNNHSFNWLGRVDFVINSGGIKIHPEQIESKISSYIPSPFFSIGIEDNDLGQKQVLCVESLSKEVIEIEQIRSCLDKYFLPKEIHYFEKFEYTASGKINRLETLKKIHNAEKQVL